MTPDEWLEGYKTHPFQEIGDSQLREAFAPQHAGWQAVRQLAAQFGRADPAAPLTVSDFSAFCRAFGLATTDAVVALAESLRGAEPDAVADLAHRLALPDNAFTEVDNQYLLRVVQFKFTFEPYVLSGGGLNFRSTRYREPDIPALAQYCRACPAGYLKFEPERNDCSGFTAAADGWLAQNGLNNITIGRCDIIVYTADDNVAGQHTLQLAVAAGEAWLYEPQDRQLYGPKYGARLPSGVKCKIHRLEM